MENASRTDGPANGWTDHLLEMCGCISKGQKFYSGIFTTQQNFEKWVQVVRMNVSSSKLRREVRHHVVQDPTMLASTQAPLVGKDPFLWAGKGGPSKQKYNDHYNFSY